MFHRDAFNTLASITPMIDKALRETSFLLYQETKLVSFAMCRSLTGPDYYETSVAMPDFQSLCS